MKMFGPLQKEKTLSIMPTWQCTAECAHCGTSSSPREKTRLPLEAMLSAVDQAAENDYKVVVFTGGEPTLAGKNLLSSIARAASHGLFTRIVSNAFWADSVSNAERTISDLVRAGLTEINFSTGDQHSRFVRVENVIRATRASVKSGMRVSIMVETVKENRITKEYLEDHPEFIQIRDDFPDSIIMVYESPWMPLSPSVINNYQDGALANSGNVSLKQGCNDVLTTTTLEADGTIAACCGIGMKLIPELRLGNIRNTSLADADHRANGDFLKRWIRIEGPERILAWASEFDSEIKWQDMYAHRCQACIRLYTDPAVKEVIREHYEKKIPDVIFGEWLLYDYSPETEPVTAS
jgi:organic radical activating enzyme